MRDERRTGSRAGALADIATRQHGVISRAQLHELGFSDRQISRGLADFRLHRVFRGVFAVGHRSLTEEGRCLAAVLACGPDSVVSHRSAAARLGLVDTAPALVEVVAPGRRGRRIAGIRRHLVAPPEAHELDKRDRIPITNASRTIVDLAGMLGERSLRRIVERAAAAALLDPGAIDLSLSRQRRRGSPTLRAILSEWEAVDPHSRTLRSPLEARLLALISGSGVPPPLCNHRVDVGGRRLEVDLLWPAQRLAVEADGHAFHSTRADFERDRRRDRDLNAAGYRVLRVTHRQLESEPEAVVDAIRRLLADLG